jgi:hypothetical protein
MLLNLVRKTERKEQPCYDHSIHGTKVLKQMLKKLEFQHGLDSVGLGQSPLMGSCEYSINLWFS